MRRPVSAEFCLPSAEGRLLIPRPRSSYLRVPVSPTPRFRDSALSTQHSALTSPPGLAPFSSVKNPQPLANPRFPIFWLSAKSAGNR